MVLEEFLVCSVCTKVSENRPSRQLYQLCISREFIREERDFLLEEVYIIQNYCDEIMASSLGEGLS